ncbi:hypothetical protein [Bythopirellula polymerisocia]|uniref:Cytochrome c domain-containing protein n=1 Tax=Bythopirellula polymerisocia TaxID=2528003 RepID=A0A5C6CR14_9BACT|nr:hypothetical protein [Bythopirellula polymerisocia]TWU26004.1 hypothetical protein Pla144_32200 [Bythopirellula polymerisocia]
MHYRLVLSMLALLFTASVVQPAQAVLQFQKEFVNLYVGDDKESDWALEVKAAKCWVCHQGKLRKHHNPYGQLLVPLLDKKKDAKNPEKIVEALKKVADMHSVEGDDKSPTFGELIKSGKLPGGSLDDCKKEPETTEE